MDCLDHKGTYLQLATQSLFCETEGLGCVLDRALMMCDRAPGPRLQLIGCMMERLESTELPTLKSDAQLSLDSLQRESVLGHHQTESFTGLAYPGCPSDTMDVGIGSIREVEIDDMGDIRNV